MIPSHRRLLTSIASLLGVTALGGCVERTMKIDSDPQGARVFVNDEEVGVTPVKFSFLWYGDYDILLRKEGFGTLKAHHRVNRPWYRYAPIDLIAECLVPTTIKDEHILPTYQLEPERAPPIEEVVERAVQARDEALYEEP